jgi:hypothetical protein
MRKSDVEIVLPVAATTANKKGDFFDRELECSGKSLDIGSGSYRQCIGTASAAFGQIVLYFGIVVLCTFYVLRCTLYFWTVFFLFFYAISAAFDRYSIYFRPRSRTFMAYESQLFLFFLPAVPIPPCCGRRRHPLVLRPRLAASDLVPRSLA